MRGVGESENDICMMKIEKGMYRHIPADGSDQVERRNKQYRGAGNRIPRDK